MRRYKHIVILLVFLLMVSCGRMDTESNMAVQDAAETSSNFSSIPSPISIPQKYDKKLITQCVGIVDHLPDNSDFSGVLVFGDSLFNLETGDLIQFRDDWKWGDKRVSPENEKLAILLDDNLLKILNAAGGEINDLVLPIDEQFSLAYWLNSDMIVLGMDMLNPSSFLMDINTGVLTDISTEAFPDFSPSDEGIGVNWYPFGTNTRSSISPDRRFIVYGTYLQGVNQIVLWNLEDDVEIARLDGRYDSTFPEWFPDSQYFLTMIEWQPHSEEENLAVESGNELVRINTSGKIERLTFLTDTEEIVSEYFPVISPDGERIAFWMGSGLPLGVHQLAILDIASGKVTNHCLKGTERPIWSPDGSFLAVKAVDPDHAALNLVNHIYIVDFESNSAYLVKEREAELNGWMNYDSETVGENVYIPPEKTDLDEYLKTLGTIFETVEPSGEFILTNNEFDNLSDQIWKYLTTQVDTSLYSYQTQLIEEPEAELSKNVWNELGVEKQFAINLDNDDFCASEGILDLGYISITEYERSRDALAGSNPIFSIVDLYRDYDPEVEKIPFGDWGLLLLADSNDKLCDGNEGFINHSRLQMSYANYSIEMLFDFVNETDREIQREINLFLAEIIANYLENRVSER